jgi:hypothetical protein
MDIFNKISLEPYNLTSVFLLIVGGLPFIIYPVVLISNFMLLSGITTGNQTLGQLVMSYVLIITTTVYPLIYVICLLFVIARMKENKQKIALGFSIGPLGYLAVIVAVFEIARLFGWT